MLNNIFQFPNYIFSVYNFIKISMAHYLQDIKTVINCYYLIGRIPFYIVPASTLNTVEIKCTKYSLIYTILFQLCYIILSIYFLHQHAIAFIQYFTGYIQKICMTLTIIVIWIVYLSTTILICLNYSKEIQLHNYLNSLEINFELFRKKIYHFYFHLIVVGIYSIFTFSGFFLVYDKLTYKLLFLLHGFVQQLVRLIMLMTTVYILFVCQILLMHLEKINLCLHFNCCCKCYVEIVVVNQLFVNIDKIENIKFVFNQTYGGLLMYFLTLAFVEMSILSFAMVINFVKVTNILYIYLVAHLLPVLIKVIYITYTMDKLGKQVIIFFF